MDNINLIDSFLKEIKNIDRTTMSKVMQDVFKVVILRSMVVPTSTLSLILQRVI
jgi:hypothetical protein